MKGDERATSGEKCVPISRARKYAAALFISCLGLIVVGAYLISELLEANSLTDFLLHFTQSSLIFYHSMVLLSIPAFMLIGYFYQKQQNLAENLEQLVKERTSRLRESQTRLENVFAASPDAITVSDLNGNIIECNQATLDMGGFSSKEELIGKNTLELIAKKDQKRAIENLKKTLEQGSVRNIEYTFLTKDGSEYPAELSAGVIQDSSGNPTGFVAITKDITERKRAEEKIRKEKEFTLSLLKGLKEGFAVVDQEGKQILVNAELCKMTGYSEKELLNQKPPFKYWAAEGLKDINEAFEKTLRGVEGEYELIFKRKDGERFIALVSPRKTVDSDGNTIFFATIKDITEHKRAEEALRESEEKFRNIFESANDCMIYLDRSGRILEVNRKAVEVFGGSRKELLGRHFAKLGVVSPRDMPRTMKAFAKVLAGKKPIVNTIIKNKKGREIRIEVSASLMKIDDKLTGVMVVARDVTERKMAEEKLRESEERFRNLFESAGDGILTLDLRGRITSANKKIEEISGFSREEIIGKHVTQFARMGMISLKDIPFILKAFKARIKGQQPTKVYELRIKNKKGQEKFIEFRGSLIKQRGKPIGILEIIRDVTERKKMEEKLKHYSEHLEELVRKRTEELLESEKRYSVLVEESSDGVVIAQDGKMVFSNKKGLEIFGYSRDELIGLPIADAIEKLVNEKYRQLVKERHERRMRGEKVPATYEIELITKTGERLPVELSATRIHYQGRPADLVIVRDITERKQMEEQRLKLEKLATIGELATMVGHDLRNPLQSIENATYYLNNELSRLPIPQKAMEMLQVINDSANYADKIIRDLQDFSATKKPTLKKNNVNAIVTEALSQVETPENVKLITKLSHLPEIKIDKDMIKRVFLNLAVNAIQAMENGGKLKVSTKKTRGFVEVNFEDTGIGMSKKNIEKIFTPFFTTKAKGMGMGLPICKKLVDAHGGSIEVESEEGKGTTFTVKLPIQPRQMEVKTIVEE